MIRWTNQELRSIAKWLVEREVEPSRHGFRNFVMEAMRATLPKERWRAAHSLNTFKATIAPIMDEVSPDIESKVKEESLAAVKRLDGDLSGFSMESLLFELARRLAPLFAQHATTTPAAQSIDPFRKHDPLPQQHAPCKKTKILVVGPKPDQQEELRKHCPELDLRFVASHEAPSLISLRGTGCDCCLLWTSFISHAHQTAAFAGFGRSHVTLIAGGISKLKRALQITGC